MTYQRIAVLGAGSWGTALAGAAARTGRPVTLIARNADAAAAMDRAREAPRLPGFRIPGGVAIAGELSAAAEADVLLLVVPAQALRQAATALRGIARPGMPVVVCAKGIERGTNKFMTQIVEECLPEAVPAVLSGPSFATDVARGLPTAVTLAAREETVAAALTETIGSTTFRLYHVTDIRGAEIGGAAKNVLAIAAGIVQGRQFGASALAALITRGFAELFRFGKACGARPETLTGLSGLGDLILTCSNLQSRNFSAGIALGQGRSVAELRAGGTLAEGIETAPALLAMAEQRGIDLPIGGAVAAILAEQITVDQAIEGLMSRPLRAEM